MEDKTLSRQQFLTAEIFAYSYANYADHMGIGNDRFENLMPDDAATLEKAVIENWEIARVAKTLAVDCDAASSLIASTKDALKIVDARNPAIAFREAILQLVTKSSEEGLDSDDAVSNLVTQVCYRVSDLAHLLAADGTDLMSYCKELRREIVE
jgi:hypothetical protein